MERPSKFFLSAAVVNMFLIAAASAQTASSQAIAPEAVPPQATPAQSPAGQATVTQSTVTQTTSTQTTAAQTPPYQPSPSDVSNQFKSGANHLGNGFSQVGQGIKQGAILTWDSIVDGVSTTKSHLEGNSDTTAPQPQ